MVEGPKREWDVSGHLLRALGLLALAGVSVGGGFLVGRPLAVVIGVAAVLLAGAFAEGTYQQWRLAEDDRVEARGMLDEDNAPMAVAARFRGLDRELELLAAEVPPKPPDRVKLNSFATHLNDVITRAARELRLHAPEFIERWGENPPEPWPTEEPDATLNWLNWTRGQLQEFAEDLERRP